jgi:anti-sigma regulatory factor (Ser/Thr protein kinase)
LNPSYREWVQRHFFAVALVASLAIYVVAARSLLLGDVRAAWQKSQDERFSQMATALRDSVQMSFGRTADQLTRLASIEYFQKSPAPTDGRPAILTSRAIDDTSFVAVAMMESSENTWRTQWVATSERTRSQEPGLLQDSYWQQISPPSEVDKFQFYVMQMRPSADGAGRRSYLAFVVRVNLASNEAGASRFVVGLLERTFFGTISFAPVSSQYEMAVMDSAGVALAYSRTSYLGSNLSGDALLGRVLKDTAARGVLKSATDDRAAYFVSFPRANVKAAFIVSAAAAFARVQNSILLTMIFLAGAVALMGVGLVNLLRPAPEPAASARSELIASAPVTVAVAPKAARATDRLNLATGPFQDWVRGSVEAVDGILGQVQLGKTKVTDEDLRQHLRVIEREARRVRKTLGHVEALTSDKSLEPVVFQARDVVIPLLTDLSEEMKARGIDLIFEGTAEVRVRSRRKQLRWAIEEIIQNSVEAMAERDTRRITLEEKIEENFWVLRIKDTGIGIPGANLGKVFDPVYTTKTYVGAGLGLAAVVAELKKIDGRVDIESSTEAGTTVRLAIPLAEPLSTPSTNSGSVERVDTGRLEAAERSLPNDVDLPAPEVESAWPLLSTLPEAATPTPAGRTVPVTEEITPVIGADTDVDLLVDPSPDAEGWTSLMNRKPVSVIEGRDLPAPPPVYEPKTFDSETVSEFLTPEVRALLDKDEPADLAEGVSIESLREAVRKSGREDTRTDEALNAGFEFQSETAHGREQSRWLKSTDAERVSQETSDAEAAEPIDDLETESEPTKPERVVKIRSAKVKVDG